MGEDNRSAEELRRRFDEVVSGAELSDLRRLTEELAAYSNAHVDADDGQLLRVIVEVVGSAPPIWRSLALRSDLSLEEIHHILQAVFDWDDQHRHRFSVTDGTRGPVREFFDPFQDDIDDDRDDDAVAVPENRVGLGELLRRPGDELHYSYGLGEGVPLTIRLEVVMPDNGYAPPAAVLDGERPAPPPSGAGWHLEFGRALPFSVERLNHNLLGGPAIYASESVDEMLRHLIFAVCRGTRSEAGEATRHMFEDPVLDGPQAVNVYEALQSFTWFLDRAAEGGIELTSAGYLKPSFVSRASDELPQLADWYSKRNRETNSPKLRGFREVLMDLGLLRRRQGRLLLTAHGKAARQDPELLWDLLQQRFINLQPGFEREATLVLLIYIAAGFGVEALEEACVALTHLGWVREDGWPVGPMDLNELTVWRTLVNVDEAPEPTPMLAVISAAAAHLSRCALWAAFGQQ